MTSTAPPPTQTPQENASRTVWELAWPAVALNSLQVINAMLDSGFIGHLPEHDLIAYGGLTSIIFMLFSLAMALGTAATALVSRAYGAGQVSEFQKACRQAIVTAFAFGVIVAGIGVAFAPFGSKLFIPVSEPVAQRRMVEFLLIWAVGLPPLYLIQSLAGSLRGVGDTKSPMVISGVQIVLHIVLNFLLIFPPRHLAIGVSIPGLNMGLLGAAVAPAAANWLAAIAYLLYTPRTKLGSCLKFEIPRQDWTKRILKIAIPAAVMAVLRVLSLSFSMLALKSAPGGAAALGAMRPAFAIEAIMFMPSFGLGMAAAALVGQSLGMRRPDRAERLTMTAAHHAAIFTAVISLPLYFFAPDIARAMIENKPEILNETVTLIRLLCLTEVGFAYSMVFLSAMQGAGDTKRPLWVTIFSLWGLRVPLSFLLSLPCNLALAGQSINFGFGLGTIGTWIAISATQAVQGLFSYLAFRKGAWKTQKV